MKEKKVKTRAHVFISGRVQGVFFRLETKRKADQYGVKGWIRNLWDGKVEAVFEGEKDAVEKIMVFCKHGPSGAKVTNFKLIWESYKGTFEMFKLRSD